MNQKYFTEKERQIGRQKQLQNYRERTREKANAYAKEYRKNNREKILAEQKEYYKTNKEQLKNQAKEYGKTHREQINERINKRLENDINFKLTHHLRNRLRMAIHKNQKSGSAVQDLGCSVPELKYYLESKFQEGMTWENWKHDGWHIDHIKPLVSFDLTNKEEFLKANHYTNLQPLWAEENLEKGAE